MNESAREVVLMVRKNTLWRVPVFCVFAGLAAFRAAVSLLVRFAFVKMPDGSVASNEVYSLLIYAGVFVASLLVGGLFVFRGMTRREVTLSAIFAVLLNGLVLLFQMAFSGKGDMLGLMAVYAAEPFEWSALLQQLTYRVFDMPWLSTLVTCLAPLVFIPFGKRELE